MRCYHLQAEWLQFLLVGKANEQHELPLRYQRSDQRSWKGTSCFLNVLSGNGQDDFSNDASCSVPDSNESHTWVLVQGNQMTCQGGNGRRLDEVSAEAFGYRGERMA